MQPWGRTSTAGLVRTRVETTNHPDSLVALRQACSKRRAVIATGPRKRVSRTGNKQSEPCGGAREEGSGAVSALGERAAGAVAETVAWLVTWAY